MKHLILCADDYGQNSSISQAIVELLKLERLTAVSCLTTSPDWKNQAKWLHPFKQKADIGLHFNLTEGNPLAADSPSFQPLNKLLIQAHMRQINKTEIIAELRAQLDQFIAHMGQYPTYIDGHQHVHQFPIIRDAFFEVYEELLRDEVVYVRSTHQPRSFFKINSPYFIKKLIIEMSGANTFRRALIKKNIPHNKSFSGIYNFNQDYAEIFKQFIHDVNDGGMIMCHPGLISSAIYDSIAEARVNEYQFLSSDAFIQLLAEEKISLSRFRF